jgi:hypothetical protein
VGSGHLLVAAVRLGNAGATATVSDNNGDAWTVIDRHGDTGGGNGDDLELWYALNSSASPNAAPTLTIHSTVAASIRVVVAEFGGVLSTGSLDQHAIAIGTGSSPTVSTAAATSQAAELVLGYGEVENDTTFTPGTGYTLVNEVPSAPHTKVALEYRVTSAAGTYAAGFNVSSQAWAMGIATLR